MASLKLRLWNEEFSVEEAFLELLQHGQEHAVLKELTKRLLFQRSFAEYRLEEGPPEGVDALLQAFCHKQRIGSPEDLKTWLVTNRHTRDSLLKQLLYQEKVQRLQRVVVPEEAVKDAFLKRKPKLDTITFGLIRLGSEHVAKELVYRIRDDHEDFGALAKQFSSGPEAPFGGIIGPKPIFELNPELRKQLLPLAPGELTEPFTLDGNLFLIARMIRVEHAQLNPGLETAIREELFEQWTERQIHLANAEVITQDETLPPVAASESSVS